MNYYIMKVIRILLVIIGVIIIGIMNGLFVKKKSKKVNRINWLSFLIIYVAIFVFPFESFIKHHTYKDAFRYDYPSYEIRKEYVYDDCAYIMYSNHGENGFAYLIKENNYWKLIKNQNTEQQQYRSFTIVTYKNDSYNNSCRNKAGIFVIKAPDQNENFKITDSKSSEFETFVMENKLSPTSTFIKKATLIDDVDKDYTIFLNDYEQLKPFQ